MSNKKNSTRSSIRDQVSDISANLSRAAMNALAARVGGLTLKIGRSIILNRNELMGFSKEQRAWMARAGEVIRDSRQTAGLTLDDLRDSLNLEDKSLLEAMEQGSATLSFEMILRLTSLLARNDPIPFLISVLRGFNPQLWAMLEDWGFGHLPTMMERDRQWMNIYRGNDQARQLPEAQFDRLIAFSTESLNLAMSIIDPPPAPAKPKRKAAAKKKAASRRPRKNAADPGE